MFCTKCGFQNPDNGNFCQKCGNPLNASAVANAPNPSHTAVPVETHRSVKDLAHGIHVPKNPLSVAQMMMVVCALLVVVIPIVGFYEWFIRGVGDTFSTVTATDLSNMFDTNSSGGSNVGKEFLELFTLRIALESPLLLLSIYSGLMLWKKRTGALSLAKKFLLALVVFLLCSHLIFPYFFSLNESYDTTLAVEYWLTVVLLAACFVFLLRSKQVRDYDQSLLAPVEDSKPA